MTDERRRHIAIALIVAGAALRLWQYLGRGSLWLDEAAIARNVLTRGYRELLEPLDYAQIAPSGFLLFEKLAVSLFGPSERSLRLYALLTGVAALPLFYRLARMLLPSIAALTALALFAVLGRPIHYASEAKQYGGDIFFAIVLLLLAIPVLRGEHGARHALRLGVAGALAVWFSQPALFVMAGIALGLLFAAARTQVSVGRPIAVMAALWMLSALPALWTTLHALRPADSEYMRSFWEESFLPWPPRGAADLAWPFMSIYGLFHDALGMPVAVLGVVLACLGSASLWRNERAELCMMLGGIGVAIIAGMFQLFPVASSLRGFNKIAAGNGRVVLFLLPALVVLVAAGLEELRHSSAANARRAAMVLAAVTIGAPLYYALAELPHTPHDLRPALAAMQREVQKGDRLYVYYGARQAFALYRARVPIPSSSVTLGGCHRPGWRDYLREIDDAGVGSRLWVLVAHPASINGVREGALIDGYLERRGVRLGRWGGKDAYVALFDLRATTRHAAITLAPPRPPRGTVSLGFSCMGVFPRPGIAADADGRDDERLR